MASSHRLFSKTSSLAWCEKTCLTSSFGVQIPRDIFTRFGRYYNNRVDVHGRKYVFGPTQAHFSPSRRQGLKWALRRAKNIFTPKNINSIKIISEGIHSTKANLHSLCRLDSHSSFCNSFSSSLEDWEFTSWLGFSAISSSESSQIVCSGDESVSTQF